MKIEQVLDIIDRPAAWAWVRQTHLPAGVICPGCGNPVTGRRALASFSALERTYCKACGSTFQAKGAVAILRGTEWQPEEYVKFLLLHLAGLHPKSIAKLLGKSAACIRGMLERMEILGSPVGGEDQSLPGSEEQG